MFRRYGYFILLVAAGVIYFSAVDRWQILRDILPEAEVFAAGGQEIYGAGGGDLSGAGQRNEGNGSTETVGGTENVLERAELEASIRQHVPEISEAGMGSSPEIEAAPDAPGEEHMGGEPEEPGEPDVPGMGGEPDVPGMGGEPDTPEVPGMDGESGVPEEPVYMTVEDDYFSDAVFIGDSRTVGMHEYGGLEETAAFYASTGLTIYKIFDSPIVEVPGQRQKITIEEALQRNSFGKIYLMIGINEMGTGTVETFTQKYAEVVEHLRELQPEAVIYIQGILKVSTERSEQGDYINNEGIEARNLELEKLADGRNVFYLDVNPMVCDETGGLVDSYTFDGVHLKAKYIQIWKDYLKEHAVQPAARGE